jgi:thiol-disulfide isomerase/thioredoxin
MGFDGKIYESSTDWEGRFSDVIKLDQLMSPSKVIAQVVHHAKLELTEEERVRLMFDELMSLSLDSEGEKARELAQEILKSNAAPAAAKNAVRSSLKRMEAIGQPLQLQFTALDGRDVTMKSFEGKVVLVDFWATWCGPCIAELPKVKAVYNEFHARGFEIIGISFDNSKDALEKFVGREGMTWPQYFDGKGWQNRFGQEFGINSIPAMWLVDKRGILRDINARNELAGKVEKLLAAGE